MTHASDTTAPARLLVAIVNYRTPQLTIDCLESLVAEVCALGSVRVVVVDNGSADGSAERIASAIERGGWGSWASLIARPDNGGFSSGNNTAIRPALAAPEGPPQYVLLLNSDTRVLPGALGALLDFMDAHPTVGIAGSRLEHPDGRVQNSRFRFHSVWSELDSGLRIGLVSRLLKNYVVAQAPCDGFEPADWVAGASMIVRSQVFRDVGLLDEGYFLYFEEVDFCLNARRAGWSCWYVPGSTVVHLVGRSTGITNREVAQVRRPRYWFESRRRYFAKNHGRAYALCADLAWAAGFAVWRVRRVVQGKPDPDPPRFLWDFVRHTSRAAWRGSTPALSERARSAP
ncbi:MAG TPA: glycosyltransferase family 2 protein [Planctomycetota bacterium]|nr:glycosyltransferase family 2 protein [Planctomycetota bacterium]